MIFYIYVNFYYTIIIVSDTLRISSLKLSMLIFCRVAPDTELAGYPAAGYPANLFCRISGRIVKGRHKKNNRLTFFQ